MQASFFISEACRLKGIFILRTIQVGTCVRPDANAELILNETVAESILCDFDKALVTLSFFYFPIRFNLCATSSFKKVVSEPQFNKVLVSLKVFSLDSFLGIICRKLFYSPSCVFTVALLF